MTSECPLKKGDMVKCPPTAKRWHRVRAVKKVWAKVPTANGRKLRRVCVGVELVFKGLITGVRHSVPWSVIERVGYKVKP